MARPAYRRIHNILRSRILSGEYPPGHKFPCETELAKQFDVSQITIRHALRILEEHWLVDRRPRRGTVVCPVWRKKKVPVWLSDYASSMRLHLPDLQRALVCFERRVPVAWAGELLEISEGTPCLYAERVDSSNDEPLAFDQLYIPIELAGSVDEEMLRRVDFLDAWVEREGLTLAHVDGTVESQQARDEHVDRLGVKLGFPMLVVRETFQTTTGQRMVVESSYRHDRFLMLWSADFPQPMRGARSKKT